MIRGHDMTRRANGGERLAHGSGGLRCAALGLSAGLLALSASPYAEAESAWDVSAGLGETDNIRLTPTDKQSDTIGELGGDILWREQRRTFGADVTGDLAYLDYLHGYYSSEVAGNLQGNLQYALVPQLLRWTLSDNFGQGVIDPLAAVTPANREYINYASTGPDLTLPLNELNALLVDLRYSNIKYQRSPLSNNRYAATVGLRHQLSAASAISFNVRDELIRFDNSQLNPNYDQQSAYLRFDSGGLRTRLEMELGLNRVKMEQGTTSGALVRLAATRQLSPAASIVLTVGHELSDAGEDFRTLQAVGGGGLATQQVQPTADPFTNNYATFEWSYQRNRTTFGLGGGYYKVTYQMSQSQGLNENRLTVDAHAARHLTPVLEASLLAQFEREDFYNTLGNSNVATLTGLLTWRASRMLSVVVEYDHARRESELGATSYIDNRGWLKLRYGRTLERSQGGLIPPPQLPNVQNQPR
jgi:Putative beta-barrel porin 2